MTYIGAYAFNDVGSSAGTFRADFNETTGWYINHDSCNPPYNPNPNDDVSIPAEYLSDENQAGATLTGKKLVICGMNDNKYSGLEYR